MTIEQYATEQGYKKITRYTVRGLHVYRLDNNEFECVGLPFFALETPDGYQQATTKETLKILNILYGDSE